MENISLYPTLTPEMLQNSGCVPEKYIFTYSFQGRYYGLKQNGTATVKLTDPLELWKIEDEGLKIDKTVNIAYPDLLQGPTGVACRNAELGLCIIWTNKTLTQTGHILPETEIITPQGRVCKFSYEFPPGMISGDLELLLIMYVKKRAEEVGPDEGALINETGVTVGQIERKVLDFNSIYMEFPIEEYKSDKEPLWWVEFSEWEDPKTTDMFTKDNICLYLNPYYDSCPSPSMDRSGGSIKNVDILIDILAQTYLLIFGRLSDDDLRATRLNIGLTSNSICSILNQFIESCNEVELDWGSPERLLKTLQINIRSMLIREDE